MQGKAPQGKAFHPLDQFHPGLEPLLCLINDISPYLFNNAWPNVKSAVQLSGVKSAHDGNYTKLNSVGYFLSSWTPFVEFDSFYTSTGKSFDRWVDIKTIQVKPVDTSVNIDIEKLTESVRLRMNSLFSILGELYANSITHGLSAETKAAKFAKMIGVICYARDGTVRMLHADMGMTIVRNIRLRAPEKVHGMTDSEVMKWSSLTGSSSKGDDVPVKGGGMTVIKELCLSGVQVMCVSGEYEMVFSANEMMASEIDESTPFSANIDNFIDVEIRKMKYNFPGTLWWIDIPTFNDSDILKKISEITNKFNDMRDKKLEKFMI